MEAAVGSTPTNGRALCNVSFRHGSGREAAPGQRYNHASYTKVGARTFCDRKDSTISTRSLPSASLLCALDPESFSLKDVPEGTATDHSTLESSCLSPAL